jgi:hypothetical protein
MRVSLAFAFLLAAAPAMAQDPLPVEPEPSSAKAAPPTAAPIPAAPAPSPPASPPPAAPAPAPPPWYPPPYQGYPPGYAPYPWYPPPASAKPAPPPPPTAGTVAAEPEPPPGTGPFPTRASWSLQLENAQGVATGKFQNSLLAGHLDYAFASRLKLGGYLALANLKGKDRRVSALLPCALVTYEKPPGPGHSVSFPIQFATGYLTRNGPVARLAAGLAWAVGQRTDLIFDLGAMAWTTRDELLLSVNVGIELRFRAN